MTMIGDLRVNRLTTWRSSPDRWTNLCNIGAISMNALLDAGSRATAQ
jgi:hypothetical protein